MACELSLSYAFSAFTSFHFSWFVLSTWLFNARVFFSLAPLPLISAVNVLFASFLVASFSPLQRELLLVLTIYLASSILALVHFCSRYIDNFIFNRTKTKSAQRNFCNCLRLPVFVFALVYLSHVQLSIS